MKKEHVENDNFESKAESSEEKENQEKTAEKVEAEDNSEQKTAELEEQIKVLKDTVLRKAAEMENLKKRCEREKADSVAYANTKFAKDLLTVLDNFDRIEDNSRSIAEKIAADASLKAIFDGISICNKELLSVLQRHGVNLVKAEKGMLFDPNFHQAMCEVEVKDAAPGKIVEIFQKGYKYNERLLRPSMVSVSKKQ